MHSDGIVTADDIARARAELRRDGLAAGMDALQQTEPAVFGFVLEMAHCVAGRLALFEVRPQTVRETADELLVTALTCLIALRMAHARLWAGKYGGDAAGGSPPLDSDDIPF